MPTRLRHDLSNLFLKPPYDGVVWLAWLYVVFACFFAGGGPFAGDLVWFDDRVRLVQIFDWLNGQDWYDRTITRVNAPEGFHSIWSRVVDLPAAGIIAALQSFTGQMRAGMITSIIVPLAETLLLFFVAAYMAEPLAGKGKAKLVTLFVLFGSCINPESFTLAGFHPGMLSHHSWYVLLTLMLFGAIGRLLVESNPKHIATAILAIGGLLMVGIEGLPLIAGVCAWVSIIGWAQNRPKLAFDMLRATGSGAALGLLLLPLNQPFDKWLMVSFAEPSILGPILLGTTALFFAGQFAILRVFGARKYLSLALVAALAGSLAALLTHFFPQFLAGGAAALSPEERQLAAAEHTEAQSLFHVAINAVDYARMVVPPFIATLFGIYKIRNAKTADMRGLYAFYLGLVIISFGMASLYSRYFHYAGLATAPWLLLLWLTLAKKIKRDEHYALKNFLLYISLGPLWLWLIPAANFNHNFGSHVLLFPAKLQLEPQRCDTTTMTDFLNRRYGDDKTIIVPMYRSDRFLLHTKLKIFFLANFPSQNKFIEARDFYETYDPENAHDIVTRHNVDLVAFCPQSPSLANPSPLTKQLLQGHMRFGQRLVTGQAPGWLKPVVIDAPTPWVLFEVIDNKPSDPAHVSPDRKAGSRDTSRGSE